MPKNKGFCLLVVGIQNGGANAGSQSANSPPANEDAVLWVLERVENELSRRPELMQRIRANPRKFVDELEQLLATTSIHAK